MKPKILIILMWASLMAAGCISDMKENPQEMPNAEGQFLVSMPTAYSVSATTRTGASRISQSYSNGMSLTIEEEPWTATQPVTRTAAAGLLTEWPDEPLIGLYITNGTTLQKGDIPYNHYNTSVYTSYITDNKGDVKSGEQSVTGTSTFWPFVSFNDTDRADFYAYYPRPGEMGEIDGGALGQTYRISSIIRQGDARNTGNGWGLLNYTLESTQSSDNLYRQDLMCAISEASSHERYGNKNRGKADNTELLFKHLFSLLDIQIDLSGYVGQKSISDLKISGSKVYTAGTLDIKTAKITSSIPGNLYRKIEGTVENDKFQTNMIVQPCTVESENDFVVNITLDGVEYSCPIPNGAVFEEGKKYRLMLNVVPGQGIVIRVWKGGKINVSGTAVNWANSYPDEKKAGEYTIATSSDDAKLAVSTESDNGQYQILGVYRNNVKQTADINGEYILQSDSENKVYYDIMAMPNQTVPGQTYTWYAQYEKMLIHYDSKQNSRLGHNTDATIWESLNIQKKDGTLKGFDNDWWTDEGLSFDGVDDIVEFTGEINDDQYTFSLLLKINSEQYSGPETKHYKRLFGEGNAPALVPGTQNPYYPACYLNGVTHDNLAYLGHGADNVGFSFGKDIFQQHDFVFDGTGSQKTIKHYVNGVFDMSIIVHYNAQDTDFGSLGSRTVDNSRALRGIYKSFILYDVALTADEVKQNYEINKARFNL